MIPQVYLILFLAILAETAGTTALQASQQFTRLWPMRSAFTFLRKRLR